jgi:cytoplasmic iron level regulating protein YaaA (DUF328/UPF0246 family)
VPSPAMLVLLSPAKSLDFEGAGPADGSTEPLWPGKTAQLVERLRAMTAAQLGALLETSASLTA